MRCPKCHYVTSNKKDICPRCHEDLRPQKKSLGLPIMNEEASVADLVKNLPAVDLLTLPPPVAPSVGAGELPKKTSLISGIFSIFNTKKTKPTEQQSEKTVVISAEKPTDQPIEKQLEIQTSAAQNEPDMTANVALNFDSENSEPEVDDVMEDTSIAPASIDQGLQELLAEEGLDFNPLPAALPAAFLSAPLDQIIEPENNTSAMEADDSQQALFSEDLLTTFEASLAKSIEEAQTETKRLANLKPEILEFNDVDEELDRHLSDLIGEEEIQVTAVKERKIETKPTKVVEEELDIAFEFEMEGEDGVSELQQELPKFEQKEQKVGNFQVESGENNKLLEGLVEAYKDLSATSTQHSLSPYIEPTTKDFSSSANDQKFAQSNFPLSDFALPNHNNDLVDELLVLIAEAYGISSDVLIGKTPLSPLEEELEREIQSLLCEGTSFYTEQTQPDRAPVVEELLNSEQNLTEELEAASSELEDLEQELSSELNALEGEGGSFFHDQTSDQDNDHDDELPPPPPSSNFLTSETSTSEVAEQKDPELKVDEEIDENDLWAMAELEIAQAERKISQTQVWEVEAAQFAEFEGNEQMTLLFDLAAEEIDDPSKCNRIQKLESMVHEHKIESTNLKQALTEYIKKDQQIISPPLVSIENNLYPPTFFRRITAELIDLSFIAICALLAAAYQLQTGFDLALWELNLIDIQLRPEIGLLIISYMLSAFVATMFLFSFLSISIFGGSIGQQICSLKVVDEDNFKPGVLHSLLFGLSQISSIVFGCFDILFAIVGDKRIATERLSGTRLVYFSKV
jgi:hypothetical protein